MLVLPRGLKHYLQFAPASFQFSVRRSFQVFNFSICSPKFSRFCSNRDATMKIACCPFAHLLYLSGFNLMFLFILV